MMRNPSLEITTLIFHELERLTIVGSNCMNNGSGFLLSEKNVMKTGGGDVFFWFLRGWAGSEAER